jgi:hypothetical protein
VTGRGVVNSIGSGEVNANTAAPPTLAELQAHEINWGLRSVAPDCHPPQNGSDIIVDVLVEAQSYRVLAQHAIHALHDLQRQHNQLRESHLRLVDERRGIRFERDAA